MEQFGKKRALNTLKQRESRLFIIHHTCFARRASLTFSIFLNPNLMCIDNSLILHIYIIVRKHYQTYFELIHVVGTRNEAVGP